MQARTTTVVNAKLPLRPLARVRVDKMSTLRYLKSNGAEIGKRATALELAVFLRGDTSVFPALMYRIEHGTLELGDACQLLWDVATVPTPEFLHVYEGSVKDIIRGILKRHM